MNPKRPTEIEGWTLQVLDAAAAGKTVEDSRVDLKKTLTDPKSAARRIAGHSNAAGGDCILWVVGVDETAGLIGYDEAEDRADWWAKVSAEFDGGIVPSLRDVIVPRADKRFLALCFETDRAPYVVKNPNGGAIGREVPWREGTAVRSAKREDLLRLLLPRLAQPDVEFLSAELHFTNTLADHPANGVQTTIAVYVTPKEGQRMVMPFHRCKGRLFNDGELLGHLSETGCHVPNPTLMNLFGAQHAPQVRTGPQIAENMFFQSNLWGPAMLELLGKCEGMRFDRVEKLTRPVVEYTFGIAGSVQIAVNVMVEFTRDGSWKTPETWGHFRAERHAITVNSRFGLEGVTC